jgi:hypothetical protein
MNVSLEIGCGAVFEIHIAAPCAIPSMPSVTRNDGMRAPVTSAPLIAPTASPTSSPATIPATSPWRWIVIAHTIAERPATEPTERSISAVEMTNVIATAMTAMIALCRAMLSRFVLFRKPSSASVIANTANSRTKPM